MMSRMEAQLQALGAQVAHLTSATTRVETELRGHVERQTDRTVRRDAEMSAVRSKLDEHERAIDSVSQWRWTMTGKLAGIMAGSAILGTGAVTAAAKLLGG
jgi:hypothetical protein